MKIQMLHGFLRVLANALKGVFVAQIFPPPFRGGGGSVASVTATAPVTSSGGANPNIALTGTVFGGVNAQTANYNIVAADAGKIVSVNSAGAVAIGLPSPPPSDTFAVFVQNLGAGITTITPAGGLTLDGGASIAFGQFLGVYISTDGTNYFTARGNPPKGTSARFGIVQVDGTTISSAAGVISVINGTQTIASGTATLGTSAIASGASASVVTVAAAGVLTTDNIQADFNADPTGTTGYAPSANGMLTIVKYPTSGNVNFKVVNNTAASITPGAITLNWRVCR